MPKPTDDVEFGTNGSALITDPGGTKKKLGFLVNEAPPAHWFNWLYRAYYNWIFFFAGKFSSAGNYSATAEGVNNTAVVGTGSGNGNGINGIGGPSSGTGIVATGGSTDGIGIQGTGTGTGSGVKGISTAAVGVEGVTTSNVAVKGTAINGSAVAMQGVHSGNGSGFGVWGQTTHATSTGVGVKGENSNSLSGVGVFAEGGLGIALQIDRGTSAPAICTVRWTPVSAQPTGASLVGDMYVTTGGDLIICTVAGTPGTWRRVGRLGTPTNDNAVAGDVGELLGPLTRVRSNSLALTTATPANVATTTSLTLTPGDWEIRGAVTFLPAATTGVQAVTAAISATSATLPATDTTSVPTSGEFRNDGFGFNVAVSNYIDTLVIPPYRVTVAAAATRQLFLVAQATFSVSTLTCCGWMEARRIR